MRKLIYIGQVFRVVSRVLVLVLEALWPANFELIPNGRKHSRPRGHWAWVRSQGGGGLTMNFTGRLFHRPRSSRTAESTIVFRMRTSYSIYPYKRCVHAAAVHGQWIWAPSRSRSDWMRSLSINNLVIRSNLVQHAFPLFFFRITIPAVWSNGLPRQIENAILAPANQLPTQQERERQGAATNRPDTKGGTTAPHRSGIEGSF